MRVNDTSYLDFVELSPLMFSRSPIAPPTLVENSSCGAT
jgi:hypothetical protein